MGGGSARDTKKKAHTKPKWWRKKNSWHGWVQYEDKNKQGYHNKWSSEIIVADEWDVAGSFVGGCEKWSQTLTARP